MGRCPGCGEWGTIGEFGPPATGAAPVEPLGLGEESPEPRIGTALEGMDRVLGGGLVRGSVTLIAGEPGIGKSTLVLQLVGHVAGVEGPCLVASGEESRAQVAIRARRLGLATDRVSFVAGRELGHVLDAARAARPAILVVDSIQAIRDPALPSLPGGPAQVRACTDALVGLAKTIGVTVLLIGQVTKDGDVAGPKTLEHAVDVVCSFDGDEATGLRVLAGGKNRFGPEGELAWFEMAAEGLREVDSRQVLAPGDGEAGAATALVTAGRRALAVEVQGLTAFTEGHPRRHVSGLDPRRFGLVAAVVDRATRLRLTRSELYGAAAGGLRIDDPGADLAMAAALASSATGVPPPPRSAFAGEVSLTGAVRPPPGLGLRLAAAAAAGVRTVFCSGDAAPPRGVRLVRVRRLEEALSWALSRQRRRAASGPDEPDETVGRAASSRRSARKCAP